MGRIAIVSATRTASGKFGGSLSTLSSVDLGVAAAEAAIQRIGLDPQRIDQAIFGNVIQTGAGQNIARQIALRSHLDNSSTAMTINQVCGSGLKAVRLADFAINSGDADIVLAGGTESMSHAPYYVSSVRFGHKYGATEFNDALEHDGLTDAFSHEAMGITAENVARKYHVTREEQDSFSLQSHQRASYARQNGYFDHEIIPVTLQQHGKTLCFATDETIREDTSLDKLAHLKPAFLHDGTGTVTAGNSSTMNDGASVLILMSEERAQVLHYEPLAVITGYAEAGIDPEYMGYAPKVAIEKLSNRTHMPLQSVDLFEINEAFAAQAVAVQRDLHIPSEKLNVCGGAIALGHPLGATGARLLTTLIYSLIRCNKHRGIISLCIGGGMAVAMQIER